jgi:hypothetical protein
VKQSDKGETVVKEDVATLPDVEIIRATSKEVVLIISDGGTTNSRSIKITFEATDTVGIDKMECS